MAFQYRLNAERDEEEMVASSLPHRQPVCELHNGCCWVSRLASDPGLLRTRSPGAWKFHFTLMIPHVRIRHHRGAVPQKASLRGQHSVQKLEILQRTARPKTIRFKCRCGRGRARGHRKRFGMSAHLLVYFTPLTPCSPGHLRTSYF